MGGKYSDLSYANSVWERGLVSVGSGWGLAVGSRQHGIETSGYAERERCLDGVSDCQLFQDVFCFMGGTR
jgi:hypothetical protein